jgi:hypothetical protein
MATFIPLRSKRLVCHLILALFVATASAPAVEPPTRPFPRIEAGQHTAPIRRIGVDAPGPLGPQKIFVITPRRIRSFSAFQIS